MATLQEISAQEPHTAEGFDRYLEILKVIRDTPDLETAEMEVAGQTRQAVLLKGPLVPYLMDAVFEFLFGENGPKGVVKLNPTYLPALEKAGFKVLQDDGAIYVDLGSKII